MEESAVTEVVGIVLIVALTIILGAIIATYGFNMVANLPSTYSVVLTIDKTDSTHFNITYRGGIDHDKLTALRITWPGDTSASPPVYNPHIGQVFGPAEIAFNSKNHVIVVGTFTDGKEQVLLDMFI